MAAQLKMRQWFNLLTFILFPSNVPLSRHVFFLLCVVKQSEEEEEEEKTKTQNEKQNENEVSSHASSSTFIQLSLGSWERWKQPPVAVWRN